MDRMQQINQRYLSEISKLYDIEKVMLLDDAFSCFHLIEKNFLKVDIYLVLANDFFVNHSVNMVLEQLTEWEGSQKLKHGNSYLGIMATANPDKEMTMWINGQSVCHFVLFDNCKNCLVYDKIWYYSDYKRVRKLREIYQMCFDESDI